MGSFLMNEQSLSQRALQRRKRQAAALKANLKRRKETAADEGAEVVPEADADQASKSGS